MSHKASNSCIPWDPTEGNAYGYRPSLAAGIFFCLAFGLSMIAHGTQSIIYKRAWLIPFILGALAELLGWVGRAVSYHCPYTADLFEMQFAVLCFAPAFTQGGMYIILYELLKLLGGGKAGARRLSPVPPKAYLIGACCFDVICLAVQGTGGGRAGAAYSQGTSPEMGARIMSVGIIVQFVGICVFGVFTSIVLFRARDAIRESKSIKILAGVTGIAILCMVVRGIYRSIELLQGWSGYLITHQGYFIALDGALMFIALVVFNIANPAMLLARAEKEINPLPEFVEKEISPASSDDSLPARV